jgi:hypothetical protein
MKGGADGGAAVSAEEGSVLLKKPRYVANQDTEI